jgi:hypothetical protein
MDEENRVFEMNSLDFHFTQGLDYYAPLFPLRGLQFFALGKIEWYLQHTKEALEAFTHANAIISLTHSSTDPLRLQLQQMLQNAQLEMQQKTYFQFYNNSK